MVNVASVEKVARRKEEILQAAITIFSEKGYYSASIADIANLLKIGHGTIYRYYKNKQAIFDAVVTSILQKLATVVQDIGAVWEKWASMASHRTACLAPFLRSCSLLSK